MRGLRPEDGGAHPGLRDVNQTDYSTQLTKSLGMQERVPGHLDPMISVGVTLDDYTRPEFWTMRNGSRWSGYTVVAGAVGQRGWWTAQCSANMMAVLESVTISHRFGAPLDFNYGLNLPEAGGAAGLYAALDDRNTFGLSNKSLLIGGGTAAAPVVPLGGYIICPNDNNVTIYPNAVMTGVVVAGSISVWKVVCAVANAAFTVSYTWRERATLPSERR